MKNLEIGLQLLSTYRKDLVSTYVNPNHSRYYYTFKYYKSPVALDIVSSGLNLEWIDNQYCSATKQFNNGTISEKTYEHVITHINSLLSMSFPDISEYSSISMLISSKLQCLNDFLKIKSDMDRKTESLLFNRYRDNFIWEEELKKLESKMNG